MKKIFYFCFVLFLSTSTVCHASGSCFVGGVNPSACLAQQEQMRIQEQMLQQQKQMQLQQSMYQQQQLNLQRQQLEQQRQMMRQQQNMMNIYNY